MGRKRALVLTWKCLCLGVRAINSYLSASLPSSPIALPYPFAPSFHVGALRHGCRKMGGGWGGTKRSRRGRGRYLHFLRAKPVRFFLLGWIYFVRVRVCARERKRVRNDTRSLWTRTTLGALIATTSVTLCESWCASLHSPYSSLPENPSP